MNITPNFTYEEMTASQTAARNGWLNKPTDIEYQNLVRLCEFLETVRAELGRTITVTSGYRSKQVNDAVGSKDSSQHRVGCAADIRVSGMTPDQVVATLIMKGLPYDQLIREFDSWTHISVPLTPSTPPRKQALIIDRKGTRPYQ
jgi:hypothetical protein